MSKHETFAEYPPRGLAAAETALLTIWPTLNRYHDDLVLVGGLAVHYLTRTGAGGWPGAVTMDVDFGIALAAEGGQYGTIQSDLGGLGFKQIAGPITPRGKRKRFQKVREAAGFKSWENNVMRHSFGSYRLAQCQDAARVSLEMGNSPQMVFSHYRELVKPKDAELYWKITPGAKGANVFAFEPVVA